jgi:hypothetical protein
LLRRTGVAGGAFREEPNRHKPERRKIEQMGMIHIRSARLLASVAGLAMLATALAGCKTTQDSDTTGSIGATPVRSEQEWRRQAEAWGERYRANQGDARAAIEYTQALRMIGQRANYFSHGEFSYFISSTKLLL